MLYLLKKLAIYINYSLKSLHVSYYSRTAHCTETYKEDKSIPINHKIIRLIYNPELNYCKNEILLHLFVGNAINNKKVKDKSYPNIPGNWDTATVADNYTDVVMLRTTETYLQR